MVSGYCARVDVEQGGGDLVGPADAVKQRGGAREGEDLEEGSTWVVGQDEAADAELGSPCDDV